MNACKTKHCHVSCSVYAFKYDLEIKRTCNNAVMETQTKAKETFGM